MPGDALFQRQFDLVGEDDGHRPVLDDGQRALRREAVGGQLFALRGVDFRAEFGQQHGLAGGDEGQRQAGIVGGVHGGSG